jgi:hypothetical protein
MEARNPLILIGRGGSGTRLLAEIFINAGVFLGSQLNVSSDSLEWVPTLYGLLGKKLARTSNPEELTLPDGVTELQNTALEILARAEIEDGPGQAWGWKLPETMFLIPEVLHAFPDAKVVHIVRHPVTSALRRTHKTSRVDDEIGRLTVAAARKTIPVQEEHNLDFDTLNNALTWCHQVGSVTRFCRENLSPDHYLELRFEDLFSRWHVIRDELVTFTGIPMDQWCLPKLDPSRARSFELPDERIDRVWRLSREIAAMHGYGIAGDGLPLVDEQQSTGSASARN